MNTYEFMLILSSTVTEDDRTAAMESIKTLLKSEKAKVAKEDIWGDKKMAYAINGQDRGFYVLYTIEANPESLKNMTKELNLEKNIWRHMFVKSED